MEADIRLEPNEARVLGVLIEKELTVPDQYPLSLNATTAGCNQKSNRSPLMALSETEVAMQLDKLVVLGLAGRVHPASSRVERFCHNACQVLDLSPHQAAILAELMMRGPQSRGDLRTRVNRMGPVPTLEALAAHLDPLISRGTVKRIPPAAGTRVERFAQQLAPAAQGVEPSSPSSGAPASRTAALPQMQALEARVELLERQLANLAGKLGEPLEE
jgi:uncharacterized protein YceH (UPF0502 family)